MATSRPATRQSPEVLERVVVRMEMMVVLPAPLGPNREKNSPLFTLKLISSTDEVGELR